MGVLKEGGSDLKKIFGRFRKRDFSGNAGQAIKDSSYQLTQNIIFKFGSLLFTIVIARLLMPELFGLYSLALSTIVLFASFSDLGVGSALITFGARCLNKKDLAKTKGYAKKLFKWKLWLIFLSSGILLISSYFIAEFYYHKPIFYALLVGAIYIPLVSMIGFIETLFKTTENFKFPMFKEIIFQIARFILVPLAILLFLKVGLQDKLIIALTLLAIVVSYFIAFLFLAFNVRKRVDFLKIKPKELNRDEVKDLKKFLYPLSATALAGMFFGYVDTLMLGHYVQSQFIAYYSIAFSLVGGVVAILGFTSMGLLPLFSKLTGKSLNNLFRKARNIVISISLFAGIATYFLAYYVIKIIYGAEYLNSVPILRWFSILIFLMPLIGLFGTYFTAQKRTKILAWLIVFSAILNIILNFIGINYGLRVAGDMGGVFGAVGATILSRIFYLGGLVLFRKKRNK